MSLMEEKKLAAEAQNKEMEIMEFMINDNLFGLDVAQVREIMMPEPVTPMPYAPQVVEGVFKPREKVITVINLPAYLGLASTGESERSLFIITEFCDIVAAFRVHSVVGIDRINCKEIQETDETISGGAAAGIVIGIASHGGHLITILDFKKILSDIAPVLNNKDSIL